MAKKKFPDLSGDGKVTQKDILIGRGVIEKKAGGGLVEATNKLKAQGLKGGGKPRGTARGMGAAKRGGGYNI